MAAKRWAGTARCRIAIPTGYADESATATIPGAEIVLRRRTDGDGLPVITVHASPVREPSTAADCAESGARMVGHGPPEQRRGLLAASMVEGPFGPACQIRLRTPQFL